MDKMCRWDKIEGLQVPFILHTYSEVVARVVIIERDMNEAQRLRIKNVKFSGYEK